MSSSNNSLFCFLIIFLFFSFFLPSSTSQPSPVASNQTCFNYQFPNQASFASCQDLHLLNSFIHWTFHPSNNTIDMAFRMTQISPDRWVSWALNPTSSGMVGSQAFIAYTQFDGITKAYTSPITRYATRMNQGNLTFPVSQLSAIYLKNNQEMIIFAKFNLPSNTTVVNHVWQEGPMRGGILCAHSVSGPNLRSFSTIDFLSGKDVETTRGGKTSITRDNLLKVVHGVLNMIGWGILMPMGTILPVLKIFPCMKPFLWLNLHMTCQISGYLLGLSGGLIGVVIGLKKQHSSFGVAHPSHAYIGVILLVLATLQVLVGAFMRPKKNDEKRIYWNLFHLSVGYSTVGLGIYNVFGGLKIMDVPYSMWATYIILLLLLAFVFSIFQVWRCVKFARRMRASMRALAQMREEMKVFSNV